MRLRYLLPGLLALTTVGTTLAQEQPSQRTQDFSALLRFSVESLPDRASQYHLPKDSPDQLDRVTTESGADTVCYTMRSYLVRREDPQSDVIAFAGYKECQLASKFQLRTTLATAPNP